MSKEVSHATTPRSRTLQRMAIGEWYEGFEQTVECDCSINCIVGELGLFKMKYIIDITQIYNTRNTPSSRAH